MRLEELERAEKMRLEELERAEKMKLEKLERAEKIRLEELVKEQALKEKELQLKFDLERFKIESGFRIQVKSGGVFRQKFVQHQKKSDSTWKDFTFEITNYLDEWLIGLEINTFQDLKDLMVVDQVKKRANASMKDHFLDNWANLKSATQIAELSDNYEDVRKPRISLFTFGGRGNFGTVQTKAAVCGNNLNQHGRYLLGNKTAELIKGNLGYNFLPVEILNAVQTRSQVKAAREERGIDSGEAKKGKMRVTRENLINAQKKNSEEIKSLYEQAASQVQVTNQVYSLEKELLVKNREDKLGNVVKLIVVLEGLRDPIKSLCHEGTSAHLGITKSKDKLNRYFYWPNCYRDMEQFVKTCDQCQMAGKPNDKKKAPLKLVPVIQEVFTKLNINACGPLPITSKGNRYLITAICMSSKFPEAIPVSDISSVSVTDALLNVFSRMGFPREIQYAGSEWDKHLPSILLALRTVSHESTGYTPSELVYGKNLRTPETLVMEHWMEPEEGDLVTEYMFKLINRLQRCQEIAINKMEEMQVKRKTWYDKNAVKREFKDGDLVLVLATSRANKLAVQWIGPGTILIKFRKRTI
ncbi:retrovirus-related Pol polyprotein from transposon 17.6 [Trichonephila clavipes]|nr:retrovirus-related Pol polyprotein from transposon 17.6 [Trichonephila clavipes]